MEGALWGVSYEQEASGRKDKSAHCEMEKWGWKRKCASDQKTQHSQEAETLREFPTASSISVP